MSDRARLIIAITAVAVIIALLWFVSYTFLAGAFS